MQLRRFLPVMLLAAVQISPFGAEARFLAVVKGSLWEQLDSTAPRQQAGNAHYFRAHVEGTRVDSIGSASVKWPNSTVRNLSANSYMWEYFERFATRAGLNSAHPNGTYSFVVQSALDGRKATTVTVAADTYPAALRIANFNEAQAIDSKTDFTLRWDASPLSSLGFVHLRILKDDQLVFQSPSYPQAPGALGGSSSQFQIPKNTLKEGTVYRGELTLYRRTSDDLTGYPGVATWAAYTQVTQFALRTQFSVTDVHWYGFAKAQRYVQTSAESFEPESNRYEFMAFTDATATANITGASIGSTPLMNTIGSWRFNDKSTSQHAFDARYPATAMSFTINTAHNGVRNLSLSLPAGNYPAAPQISNFNEAGALDTSKPFILKWNVAAGTAGDFVQVCLRKGGSIVLKSGDYPAASGALNGTSTSFNVPANFLASGETCEASITFLKAAAIDSYSYPKALGFCGYGSVTIAALRGRSAGGAAPKLTNLRRQGGNLEFDLTSESGRQYVLQTTTDFSRWTDLLVTNASASSFHLRVPVNSGGRQQVIRAVAN